MFHWVGKIRGLLFLWGVRADRGNQILIIRAAALLGVYSPSSGISGCGEASDVRPRAYGDRLPALGCVCGAAAYEPRLPPDAKHARRPPPSHPPAGGNTLLPWESVQQLCLLLGEHRGTSELTTRLTADDICSGGRIIMRSEALGSPEDCAACTADISPETSTPSPSPKAFPTASLRKSHDNCRGPVCRHGDHRTRAQTPTGKADSTSGVCRGVAGRVPSCAALATFTPHPSVAAHCAAPFAEHRSWPPSAVCPTACTARLASS